MEEPKPRKHLSTLTKVLIGVGVVGAGALAVHAIRKKDEPAPTGSGTPSGGGAPPLTPATPIPVEAVYSATPGLGVPDAHMPLLPHGSKFLFFGSPVNPASIVELATNIGGEALADPITIDGDRVLFDAATAAAQPGSKFIPNDNIVWIGYLGEGQAAQTVELALEYVRQMRKAAGAGQRIAWVLAPSVPGSIAKALQLSNEDWVRLPIDVETMPSMTVMLTGSNPQEISNDLAALGNA